MIKDMAEALVKEAPDYRKSVISKQHGERIEKPLVPKILGREDLVRMQMTLKAEQIKKRTREISQGEHGDGVEAMKEID